VERAFCCYLQVIDDWPNDWAASPFEPGVHVSDLFPKSKNQVHGLRNTYAVTLTYMTPTKDNTMAVGTVKWFNNQKGFGFIQPEEGGADVFVHISAVERAGMSTLQEGQKISFELVTDRRRGKSSAENLRAV
jgi:cold shock protein